MPFNVCVVFSIHMFYQIYHLFLDVLNVYGWEHALNSCEINVFVCTLIPIVIFKYAEFFNVTL